MYKATLYLLLISAPLFAMEEEPSAYQLIENVDATFAQLESACKKRTVSSMIVHFKTIESNLSALEIKLKQNAEDQAQAKEGKRKRNEHYANGLPTLANTTTFKNLTIGFICTLAGALHGKSFTPQEWQQMDDLLAEFIAKAPSKKHCSDSNDKPGAR